MTGHANVKKTSQERQLLDIVRRLPRDLVSQVINFAQFLEFQRAKTYQEPQEQVEHVAEGDAKWETLLASDDGQRLLEKMADEAANEISAGKAKPMRFTDDGQLIRE